LLLPWIGLAVAGNRILPPTWEETMTTAAERYRAGDYSGAQSLYHRAFEAAKAFGRQDPRRIHTFNSLCGVTYEMGNTALAERYCQTVLRELPAQLDSALDRINRIHALHLLAAIQLQSRRLNSAARLLQRLESDFRSITDPPLKLHGILHYDFGFLEFMLGHLDSAEARFRKAADAFAQDPDDLNLHATTVSHLSALCIRRKRYAEAEVHATRAIELLTSRYGPSHPDIARDLHNLAMVYLSTERLNDAERALQRAIPLLESTLGNDASALGAMTTTYARVLTQMGRKREAKDMQDKAEVPIRHANATQPGRWVVDIQSLADPKR
jgi:hypothetical protein